MNDEEVKFTADVLKDEFGMVKLMIELYCRQNHQSEDSLCADCQELLDYTQLRLSKCPFAENKGPCSKCKVHCFQEPFKSKIREVMKFSGPRMMLHHPVKAVKHLLKGKKRVGKADIGI